MKSVSFFILSLLSNRTKNSCRDTLAGSPSTQVKVASMNCSLTGQLKNKWRGVSSSTSWLRIKSQKVQFGECPGTKCATALLYPAVLLCSLKRNVRVALEREDFAHILLSFSEFSKLITVSVLFPKLTILCGMFFSKVPIIFFLYRLHPLTLLFKKSPISAVFISLRFFFEYLSLAFDASFFKLSNFFAIYV